MAQPSDHQVRCVAAVSMFLIGCNGCRGAAPPPPAFAVAPTDASAEASAPDAGATTRKPKVEEDAIAFSRDGRFVVLAGADGTVLVDVRSRRGIARTSSRPYRVRGEWTTFGSPIESSPSHPFLATVGEGRFAVIDGDPPELDELATGARTPVRKGAEVYEGYTLLVDGAVTRIHTHAGRDLELAGTYEPVTSWVDEVLVSATDEGHTRVADPATGRTLDLTLQRPDVVEAHWMAADRSRLAVHTRTAFTLYAFPEGKVLAKAATGAVIRDHASADGAIWAWVDFETEPLRCSVGALVAATASTWRTALPCRKVEGEKVIWLHDADRERVLVETTAEKLLDARTGKPWAGPKPKPKPLETIDEKALAKEIESQVAANPSFRAMSLLIQAKYVLEAKHGYEVVEIGDAHTLLARRGDAFSVCELARGEPCKKAFDEAGKVTVSFSPDGERLAVASPTKLRVLDGVTGDVLFERVRPSGP